MILCERNEFKYDLINKKSVILILLFNFCWKFYITKILNQSYLLLPQKSIYKKLEIIEDLRITRTN